MKIQLLLNIMLFAFVLNINTTLATEIDALSFVLTNEGNDRMIERLESAGCNNLYEALVYLRKNMANDAPTVLINNMDTLLDSLKKLSGIGEVFTASLHDFIGIGDSANSPVGINSDGTFIRNAFSVHIYDSHEGYRRYTVKELFTYAISPEHYIYMGSNDLDNGITINYLAFAIAWGDSTISGVFDDIENNNINISPNPATDYIEIIEPSEGSKPSEGLRICIYNTLGECVINYELQITNYDNGIKINVSNLPVGVYYICINNKYYKFIKI